MRRAFQVSLLGIAVWLLLAAPAMADEKPVGSWDCVSTTPVGTEMKWTLTVKEEDGKLVGTASVEDGVIPISEVKWENGTLNFRVSLETGVYLVTLRFSGDKVDGDWKCDGSDDRGKIHGVRKA